MKRALGGLAMGGERIWYLRDALADGLAEASCSRIERSLGGELAEDLEDIMGAARATARRVQQAAPAVLQGAAAGYLAGGPTGAVVGGALGALGHPSAAAAPVIANPAALELLLTMLRPEIVEALMAMALGRHGARTVPVAGVKVPASAAAELVQSLAEQACAAHPQRPARGVPRYLADAHARGEELDSAEVRAESLRALLRESAVDLDDDYDEED